MKCEGLLGTRDLTITPLQIKKWTLTGPKTTGVLRITSAKNSNVKTADFLDFNNEILLGWSPNNLGADLIFSIQGYQIRVPQIKNSKLALQILPSTDMPEGFYIAIKSNLSTIQTAQKAITEYTNQPDQSHKQGQLLHILFDLFTSSTNGSQSAVSFANGQPLQLLVIGEITEDKIRRDLNRIYKMNSLRNPNLLAAAGFVGAASVLWYIMIDGFLKSLQNLNNYSHYIQP